MQFILAKYNPCLFVLTHLFKLACASLMQFWKQSFSGYWFVLRTENRWLIVIHTRKCRTQNTECWGSPRFTAQMHTLNVQHWSRKWSRETKYKYSHTTKALKLHKDSTCTPPLTNAYDTAPLVDHSELSVPWEREREREREMKAGGDHLVWSRWRMPLKCEPVNREGPCCLSFEKVFHFPKKPPNQTDVGYRFGYLRLLFVLSWKVRRSFECNWYTKKCTRVTYAFTGEPVNGDKLWLPCWICLCKKKCSPSPGNQPIQTDVGYPSGYDSLILRALVQNEALFRDPSPPTVP
jgi:hypothetical protein